MIRHKEIDALRKDIEGIETTVGAIMSALIDYSKKIDELSNMISSLPPSVKPAPVVVHQTPCETVSLSALEGAVTLGNICNRSPIGVRRRRWTQREDKQMINLLSNGASQTDVASQLNRTPRAIESRLKLLRSRYMHLQNR